RDRGVGAAGICRAAGVGARGAVVSGAGRVGGRAVSAGDAIHRPGGAGGCRHGEEHGPSKRHWRRLVIPASRAESNPSRDWRLLSHRDVPIRETRRAPRSSNVHTATGMKRARVILLITLLAIGGVVTYWATTKPGPLVLTG